MISIDDLVVRFDHRDGYDLVDYEIVGLPVWKLGLLVQTLEDNPIAATEEFVLRLIYEGIDSVEGIAALLGLDEGLVTSIAGDLVRMDAIANQAGKMRLTRIGDDLRRKAVLTKPTEHTIQIHYDAILKRPHVFQYYQLFSPSEIRSEGIRGINPSPNRKPEASELEREAVESYIKEAVKGTNATTVIRIKGVTSRWVLYQKAVMVVFRATHGDDVQVAFAIDRRLSDEHEFAFAQSNGLKRLGIEGSLRQKERSPEEILLGEVEAKRLSQESDKNAKNTASIRKELSQIRGKLKENVEDQASLPPSGANDAAAQAIKSLIVEKQKLEKQLKEFKVHMVSVYEHPDYLRDAIEKAKQRILIISPWITRAVVDAPFLRAMRERLNEGVQIFIGYGLDERQGEPPIETSAERDLLDEAGRSPNLHLRRLGDTHAKVLIKDDEYMITTSFNWLSFRGNPNRRFREEWGTFIGIPDKISDQFVYFSERIACKG